MAFWHSKFYFDIRTEAVNRILRSKSYFDIRIGHEYRILTFKLVF